MLASAERMEDKNSVVAFRGQLAIGFVSQRYWSQCGSTLKNEAVPGTFSESEELCLNPFHGSAFSGGSERLIEIFDDIVDILQTHRQAD